MLKTNSRQSEKTVTCVHGIAQCTYMGLAVKGGTPK